MAEPFNKCLGFFRKSWSRQGPSNVAQILCNQILDLLNWYTEHGKFDKLDGNWSARCSFYCVHFLCDFFCNWLPPSPSFVRSMPDARKTAIGMNFESSVFQYLLYLAAHVNIATCHVVSYGIVCWCAGLLIRMFQMV